MQIQDARLPIHETAIVALVGRTTAERGRSYAKRGRVVTWMWAPDRVSGPAPSLQGSLVGRVSGTRATPYRARVHLVGSTANSVDARPVWKPMSSTCTCPVGVDCKHAAALLYSASATRATSAASAGPRHPVDRTHGHQPARFDDDGDDDVEIDDEDDEGRLDEFDWPPKVRAAAARMQPPISSWAPPAAPPPESWRSVLRDVLGDGTGSRSLAIGVDLVADHGRFGFSRFEVRSATPRDVHEGGPLAIALRPLCQGVREPWIKNGLTWRNFRTIGGDRRFPIEQCTALSHIVGFVLAENPNRYDPGEMIRLDDLRSPAAWRLVRAAFDAGIPLVGMGVLDAVEWGAPAAVRLDVRRAGSAAETGTEADGATDDDLLLSAVVERDGAPITGLIPSGAGGFARLVPASETDGDGAKVDGAKVGVAERRGDADATRWRVELVPVEGAVPRAARILLDRPEPLRVPAADAGEFLGDVAPHLRRAVPVVSSDPAIEIPDVAPPRLVLTVRHGSSHGHGDGDGDEPTVLLERAWSYRAPARTLPMRQPRHGQRPRTTTTPHNPDRDEAAEDATLDAVRDVWPPAADPALRRLSGVEAAEFVHRILPRLAALDGVDVRERGDRPPFTELEGEPRLRITQVDPARASDRDWLELGFEITLGEHLVPFTAVFKALSQGKKAVLLPDKTYAKLDHPMFDRLRELIAEAETMEEWEPERPRIGRYQVTLWDDFEDLADEAVPAVAWRETIGALRDLDEIPTVPAPSGLAATLRPYQRDGLDWLAFLHAHGLGGILADDMGLGKTLQTLALVSHARERDPAAPPFLVVAPSSVLGVWRREAERFAPGLDVRVLDRTTRKRGTPLDKAVRGADLVVTSYAIARIDDDAFAALDWSGLVLDEAQFVKNRAAKTHRAVARIPAPFRLAITGTPLENSLTDLWALLSLTAPGLFASPRRFREEYVRPIEEAGPEPESRATAAARLARLRRRARPFLLRRTKDLVARELPPKQEQRLEIDLAPAHRRLYDRVLQRERQKLLRLVDDLDRNRFIVFRSLTLLRMLALDPAIVDDEHAAVPSSKLDALLEQLPEAIADGHRVIVFSQFTSFLARVAARLDEQGIAHAYLDGSTRDRDGAVAAFREGDAPVFLISLKAGGFGLTLTEADYVYVMDPWWNPAAEAQAVDRAHRIGQTRTVMVYRMVASGTIEEKVLALQQRKAALFDAFTDGEAAFSGAITADDVRELLGDA